MDDQRRRAKEARRELDADLRRLETYRDLSGRHGRTTFVGYETTAAEGRILGLLRDGEELAAADEGDLVVLILDRTPFYAEGGGQLADQGVIELDNGARLEVIDVQSPISGLVVHKARVLAGEVTTGAHAQALVDTERRRSISRSHTATHMVHKAFREALGETATQAGSENSPGRFRFDFSATGAIPASAMADVEARVNDLVIDDLAVHAEIMTQAEAVKSGAMALFGEKYGDEVRVISVGDWARELCGGTHAERSGQLGVVKLLGESSIGSGVRRVEALVGGDAYRFLAREHLLVAQLSEALKARPEELPERVHDIVERLRVAEKEIEKVRLQQLVAQAGQLAADAEDIGGVSFVPYLAPEAGGGDVRTLALDVRNRLPRERPGVAAFVGTGGGRPSIVVAVNDGGRAAGISANALVRVAAEVLGGKGGGKDDVAQGGGADPSRAGAALEAIRHALAQR
jgi:alanyl-tRNA synthetase